MKKQTICEKVLQFLINKNKNYNNNKVTLTQEDAKKFDLPEQEIIRAFYLLQTDGCLKITRKCHEDNFNTSWEFELSSTGIHYFEKKREDYNTKLSEWIRWGITSLVAIAALIVAIIAL